MGLVFMDLWNIMDEFNEISFFIVDSLVRIHYYWCIKKAMFVIAINLVSNQLAYIKIL